MCYVGIDNLIEHLELGTILNKNWVHSPRLAAQQTLLI